MAHFDLYRLRRPEEGRRARPGRGAGPTDAWSSSGRSGWRAAFPPDRLDVGAGDRRTTRRAAALRAWPGMGHGRGVSTISPDRGCNAGRFPPSPGAGRRAERTRVGRRLDPRLCAPAPARRPPPLVLMDAPPAAESATASAGATPADREALGYTAMARLAGNRLDAFVATAGWLKAQGFSAPRRPGARRRGGLRPAGGPGRRPVRSGARPPGRAPRRAATRRRSTTRRSTPWPRCTGSRRLRCWRARARAGRSWRMTSWRCARRGSCSSTGCPPRAARRRSLPQLVRSGRRYGSPVRARAGAGGVFCHRDYHAENLIWRPDRTGAARVGLLDFQDAVRAPRAWDLSMLLHDARRDVSPGLRSHALERYLAAERGRVDPAELRSDFAAFGALNIVRIIGVFPPAGGARRQGALPRVPAAHVGLPGRGAARPRARPPWRAGLDAHVPPEAARVSGVPVAAMVLAAGLGTRMRPLTDDRPKALVEVGGRALIDHMLDRLAEAGVQRAVVNVHAHADRLVAHLRAPLRRPGGRDLRRARRARAAGDRRRDQARRGPLGRGADPGRQHRQRVARGTPRRPPAPSPSCAPAGTPARTACRLMLARMERTTGFDGPGDFFEEADGRLSPRRVTGAPTAPLAYMGVHMVDPAPIYARPETAFGLFPLWAEVGRGRAAARRGDGGRLDARGRPRRARPRRDPARPVTGSDGTLDLFAARAAARLHRRRPPPRRRPLPSRRRRPAACSAGAVRAGSPSPPTAPSSTTWRAGCGTR